MQFIQKNSKIVGVAHGDETGIPESQEIVKDQNLRCFEWVKKDAT